ncbi:hypothetical protein PCANB_001110 [Pneumocystis canis]|nr:hypothetical protein PCANB_001110 [Pneumocystis canis]
MMKISGTIMNHSHPLCTAVNSKNNQYVDLRGLKRTREDGYNWDVRDDKNNRNFSINICAPLIMNTTLSDNDIDYEHVSAMYIDEDKMFSIGEVSSNVYFQGEKLVLQYKNGSLCPGNTTFRKSTTISFICNPHIYKKPLIFFIADANACAYFFEWHTAFACSKTSKEHLIGPGTIFGIILLIAFSAYCVGGYIYRSTVMYARGWKRIPNYGFFFFIKDSIITLFTNLCSKIPMPDFFQQDYSYTRYIDEENRLIDDILVDD